MNKENIKLETDQIYRKTVHNINLIKQSKHQQDGANNILSE